MLHRPARCTLPPNTDSLHEICSMRLNPTRHMTNNSLSSNTFNRLIYQCIIAGIYQLIQAGSPTHLQRPHGHPLVLSGNFMEPRSDHFHSGLDIKTGGAEGVPVKSVADGWVSRIKVSPWGYGNAVYIDHGNGYTSVYGHLQCVPGRNSHLCA